MYALEGKFMAGKVDVCCRRTCCAIGDDYVPEPLCCRRQFFAIKGGCMPWKTTCSL